MSASFCVGVGVGVLDDPSKNPTSMGGFFELYVFVREIGNFPRGVEDAAPYTDKMYFVLLFPRLAGIINDEPL